jgi:hypothetical protein
MTDTIKMDKTGGTFHFPAIQLVRLGSTFNYWLDVKDKLLEDRVKDTWMTPFPCS